MYGFIKAHTFRALLVWHVRDPNVKYTQKYICERLLKRKSSMKTLCEDRQTDVQRQECRKTWRRCNADRQIGVHADRQTDRQECMQTDRRG